MSATKAVFLDRDGTIIFDGKYISKPEQVKLLPQAIEALELLRDSGFFLFLFTNQSGVGRGYFPLEAVLCCNQRMLDLLGLGSALFTDICIATESPDQLAIYRKPNPRFINESIIKHGINRENAWMVGDKLIDVESGRNAGINAALISAGSPPMDHDIPCYGSLYDFAKAVAFRPG